MANRNMTQQKQANIHPECADIFNRIDRAVAGVVRRLVG